MRKIQSSIINIGRHGSAISTTCFLLFMLVSAFLPASVQAISNQTIVRLMNTERGAAGRSSLTWNSSLGQSASLKAKHMCANDYWAHTSPTGVTPWSFIGQAGYSYYKAGENLAQGFRTDAGVVAGWMASSSHHANVMSRDFKDVGVASMSCSLGNGTTTLVVAHYGTTAKPEINVSPPTRRSAPQPPAKTTNPPAASNAPKISKKAESKPPQVANAVITQPTTPFGQLIWEWSHKYPATAYTRLVSKPNEA